MRRDKKKPVTLGFMVVAAVVAITSVAWACTTFKGKITVTPTSATDGSGSVTMVGNNSGMGWCSQSGTVSINTTGNVDVEVDAATCPNGTASQLPADTYSIIWYNGPGFTTAPTRDWQVDCMAPVDAVDAAMGQTVVGTISVNAAGYGKTTNINLGTNSANAPLTESAICVGKNTILGQQAPVTIV